MPRWRAGATGSACPGPGSTDPHDDAMRPAESLLHPGWRAELELVFAARGARTVLAARRHDGPLVVQKPLYPEGDSVCHAIVVHPPGGISGGDELAIDVRVEEGAAVLVTTPGAANRPAPAT